jgi:hypothetical protein
LKREVGWWGVIGVNLEGDVKHKINVGLCFICAKMENRI